MEINGYRLEGELTSQNAGFSCWSPCTKNGHKYFIKEFLAPVYPVDAHGISEKLVQRKRKTCDAYYERRTKFYKVLESCRTGNNVIARDFFRNASRYYLVTDWVDIAPITADKVYLLSEMKRLTLIRSLIYSIAAIHTAGIVHADLKPDNLLLKETKAGYITAKVIDYDGGFLEGNTPRDVQGDFVYLAPEAYLHMDDEDVVIGTKIDIFALGILIHQYWTGRLPTTDARYHYVFESVLDGRVPLLADNLPERMREIIEQSLLRNPEERPKANEMLQKLSTTDSVLTIESDIKEPVELIAEGTSEPDLGFYIPIELG